MTVLNKALTIVNIVLIACCFVFVIIDKLKIKQREGGLSKKAYFILFSGIMLIAVGVRLYKFGIIPGGVNQDGAMAAVDAKALLEYGTDRLGMKYPVHFTAWGYGQMSVMMSYLMIPFIKVFGLNVTAMRLPTLIVSLMGLVFLFLFIKDAFGKKAALTVLFFGAICPWHIMQSRWALDCNLFPHFFMAGVYFLNRSVTARAGSDGQRAKMRPLVISMIIFALCMYCYGVALYTVPVFLLLACIYLLLAKKMRFGQALVSFIVYAVISAPFVLCMAINYFKLDTIETPLFTIPYFPSSIRSNDIALFADDILGQIKLNLTSVYNTVILQSGDLIWNQMEDWGTTYLFTLPLAATGLLWLVVKLFAKKQESTENSFSKSGTVLVILFALTALFEGAITNSVNVNRINIAFYPMIIFIGLGLCYLTSIKCCGAIAVTALAFMFMTFTYTYFTDYNEVIEYYFMADFGEALTDVKDADVDKIYVTSDSQSEGSWYVSEILTLFYHDIDAEYYQGKIKDEDGRLFSEKYEFSSIVDLEIDENEDAAYVVRKIDIRFFDTDEYTIHEFGNFASVIHK